MGATRHTASVRASVWKNTCAYNAPALAPVLVLYIYIYSYCGLVMMLYEDPDDISR